MSEPVLRIHNRCEHCGNEFTEDVYDIKHENKLWHCSYDNYAMNREYKVLKKLRFTPPKKPSELPSEKIKRIAKSQPMHYRASWYERTQDYIDAILQYLDEQAQQDKGGV